MTPFEKMAKLLAFLYDPECEDQSIAQLLPKDDQGWVAFFALAEAQKVLSHISFAAISNDVFRSVLGEDEQGILEHWQGAFAQRNSFILDQLQDLSELAAKSKQKLILLKGSACLFDDLYPDASVRQFADLDVLCSQTGVFFDALKHGYVPVPDPAFALDGSIAQLEKIVKDPNLHHLPPLVRDGDQTTLELHTRPFYTSLQKLDFNGIWDEAIPIGDSFLHYPSPEHRVIINIIHCLFHGSGKTLYLLRLRDLLEGRLLYQRLDQEAKMRVKLHFVNKGYRRDFDLWLGIVENLFGSQTNANDHPQYIRKYFAELCRNATHPRRMKLRKLRAQIARLPRALVNNRQVILRKFRTWKAARPK